ncbi:MAG TPA: hypothetical protein ENN25_05590 [Euryarchaeota archaeon]|nr:hypothetical protein [Euryarchaeota archaeon]
MDPRKIEPLLSWIIIIWLIGYVILAFVKLDFWWAMVGIASLLIVSSGMISKLSTFNVMPFELIVILILPLYIHATGYTKSAEDIEAWNTLLSQTSVMTYSVIGMFLIAELMAFTSLKMNRAFAVIFVTVFCLSTSAIWSVFEYLSDLFMGTALIESNYAVMMRFIYSFIGGILMGVFFDIYLRLMPDSRLERFGLNNLREVSAGEG